MKELLRVGQGLGVFADFKNPFDCGRKAARQAIEDLAGYSFPPKLVFVFACSTCSNLDELLNGVRDEIEKAGHENLPMAGCTTPFPITHLTDLGTVEDGVVVSILASDEIEARVGVGENIFQNEKQALKQALEESNVSVISAPPEEKFIFAILPGYYYSSTDYPEFRDHEIFEHLLNLVGQRVTIFGGSASNSGDPSNDNKIQDIRQFAQYRAYQNTIVLVNMYIRLAYACSVELGFQTEGQRYPLTLAQNAARSRIITHIGEQPALKFLRQFQKKGEPLFLQILGSEVKHKRIEVPHAGSKDTLLFKMQVDKRDIVSICNAQAEDLENAAIHCIEQMNSYIRISNPGALFVVSCRRRRAIMGEEQSEINVFQKRFRGIPTIGFYGAGEHCHAWGIDIKSTNCAINVCLIDNEFSLSEQNIDKHRALSQMGIGVQLASFPQEVADITFETLRKIGYAGGLIVLETPISSMESNEYGSELFKFTVFPNGEPWESLKDQLLQTISREDLKYLIQSKMPNVLQIPLPRVGSLWLKGSDLPKDSSEIFAQTSEIFAQTMAIAQTVAAAFRRLHHDEELQKRMGNLVNQQAGATLDELLTEGIVIASEISESQIGSIRLVDEDIGALYYQAVYPHHPQQVKEKYWKKEILLRSYPLKGDSLGAQVVRSGKPLIYNNVKDIPGYKPVSEDVTKALHVPISIGKRTIGVLTVNREEKGKQKAEDYDIADQNRLMNIARQLGSAILYKKAASKAETVHGILASFLSVTPSSSTVSLGDVENIWAQQIMKALNSEACAIFLVDSNAPRYLMLVGHTENEVKKEIGKRFNQVGQGLTGRVAQSKKPIRLNRLDSKEELVARYGSEGSARKNILKDLPDSSYGDKPWIAVPIIFGDRLLGVIRCLGKQQIEHFSQDDEDLLKSISDAIALSVMHLWNIKEIIRREEWQLSFVNLATHQLRGPISDLAAAIELHDTELRNIGGKNSPLIPSIDRIPKLKKLIEGLLNYARVEGDLDRLKGRRANISSVVRREVMDLQEISVKNNIYISVHDLAENLEVHGDSELLRQCFNNILTNAIRFSPKGKLLFSMKLECQKDLDKGVISEDCRHEFKNNKILLSPNPTISNKYNGWLITDKNNMYMVRKEENKLNIYGVTKINVSIMKVEAIEDPEGYIVDKVDNTNGYMDYTSAVVISSTNEGPAIPKESQSKIFDLFVSIGTDEVSTSTGFGLPIAQKIARSYGGNITVVSPVKDDRGATFNIFLPIA